MSLILRQPWTRQPPDGVVATRAGWLAPDALWAMREGGIDRAFGKHFPTGTNVSRASVQGQLGVSFPGSSSSNLSLSNPALLQTTSGDRFSWFFLFAGTADTAQTLLSVQNSSGSNKFSVYVGNSVTDTLTNELITISHVAGSARTGLYGYTTATRTELLDGLVHSILVCSTGSSWRLFLDGTERTLTAGSGTNNGRGDVASASLAYIGAQNNGAGPITLLNGTVTLGAYWRGRDLSGQAATLHAAPWQLFEPHRIWVPVSAAGGSHSGALAESSSASDSATAAAAWLAAVAEPASAADLTAALLAMVAAASETGSAADSIDALRALLAGASDSGAAEDAVAALASLLAAVNESGAAADAQDGSTGSGHSGATEEAASAADTATAIAALLAASSDSVSVSDAASAVAALLAAVAEAGSAADVADWVAGSAHSGAVSEAGAIMEAAAAAAALVGAMQDAGIVDELAAAIADYRAALAEAVQLQDVVAAAAALLDLCAIVWAAPAELRTFVPAPETRTWVAPPEQRTYAPPPYPVEDLS